MIAQQQRDGRPSEFEAIHQFSVGPLRYFLDWRGLDWSGLDWSGLDWGRGVLCLLVLMTFSVVAQDSSVPREKVLQQSREFFVSGSIPNLRIEVSASELEKLNAENRTYVRCTIQEDDTTTYKNVAIKLKGAAGSFRDFDDRPALTLNVQKFQKGQTFHGLSKFHLNNSVQDETYLQEQLCGDLFRSAGIPAAYATHARVWLNGRDVGLYVLKEGFDKTFLKRHFENADGNLYDGGFVQDIDAELEKDSGTGVDDRSDLAELAEACRIPEPEARWKRVDELLDVEQFITFMALELMTCHWDGYCQNHNNYRLYFDPTGHKVHFFPHGMDQMFGDTGASILDYPNSIVAATVLQNTVWRARYRERVNELLPRFSPADHLLEQVDMLHQRIRPLLEAMDPQRAIEHDHHVEDLKQRLIARGESLQQQHDQPDPAPLEFDESGSQVIADWAEVAESEDTIIETIELPGEKKVQAILCGKSGHCIASLRRRVLLAQGDYTFHAMLRTINVTPMEDEKGSGAGIRISGAERANHLENSTVWTRLEFEFTVAEEIKDVELIAEVRATHGQAWFQLDSLRLSRKPAPRVDQE